MSSLSSTAEEILELCNRGAMHSDPKIAKAILLADIEDVVSRHIRFWGQELHNDEGHFRTLIITNRP